MFYSATDFAFTRVLEAHWEGIRAEALAIRDQMVDWHETKLHEQCWQVYGLYDFPGGALLEDAARRCPLTTRLIAEQVPTHGAAGFSLLKPGSRIHPHQGYAGRFLRCHLPLLVPEGDCALRVGRATQRWNSGRCLIFDDRVDHEAWNLTAQPRIVLLLDFIPSTADAPVASTPSPLK